MRGLSRLAAPLSAALGRLRRRATHAIIGDDLLTLALLTMGVREIRRLDEKEGGERGPGRA